MLKGHECRPPELQAPVAPTEHFWDDEPRHDPLELDPTILVEKLPQVSDQESGSEASPWRDVDKRFNSLIDGLYDTTARLQETFQERTRKLDELFETLCIENAELRHSGLRCVDALEGCKHCVPAQASHQSEQVVAGFWQDHESHRKITAESGSGAKTEGGSHTCWKKSYASGSASFVVETYETDKNDTDDSGNGDATKLAVSTSQLHGSNSMLRSGSPRGVRWADMESQVSPEGVEKILSGDLRVMLRCSTMPEDRKQFWKRFKVLDPDGGGSITAEDLIVWLRDDRGNPDEIKELETIIEEFNQRLEVDTDGRPKEIVFETFCFVMCQAFMSTKVRDLLLRDHYDRMVEIRMLLIRQSEVRRASSIIASYMNLGRDTYRRELQDAEENDIQLEKYLEPISALVILANAVTLGVQIDTEPGWNGWFWVEINFAIFYIFEIIVKILLFKWQVYFFGEDGMWNWFDMLIVACAIIELLSEIFGKMSGADFGNVTIIRLARFARFSRLLRLLKLKSFKELQLMVSGILGGFRVLVWAIVLFALVVYTLSLLLRMTIGDWQPPDACQTSTGVETSALCPRSAAHLATYQNDLFSSMPKTMLTVFRCFLHGCDSMDGSPLIPYLIETHGVQILIAYLFATFFIIFGVFNVMTAVFVEQTYQASKKDAIRGIKNQNESVRAAVTLQKVVLIICGVDVRLTVSLRTSQRINNLVSRVTFRHGNTEDEFEKTSELFSNLTSFVTREAFDHVLSNSQTVRNVLEEMDIETEDSQLLFDLLDADGSGKLEPEEVVTGLMKLRGMRDKGYQVASLLGLRALQRKHRDMHNLLMQTAKTVRQVKAESVMLKEAEPFRTSLCRLSQAKANHRASLIEACEKAIETQSSEHQFVGWRHTHSGEQV